MKSPFPGMDPYLERHWPDVHTSLVADARNALNQVLPGDLVASTEERIAVEEEWTPTRTKYAPDVQLIEVPATGVAQAAAMLIDAPIRLVAQSEPRTERSIRIIEPKTSRVITVIEFINPANKMGRGLRLFRRKRQALLRSNVNFVE